MSANSSAKPAMTFLPAVADRAFPMTTDTPELGEALRAVRRPVRLPSGECVPACRLEDLGDASFRADHGLRYSYVAGAMANGIGSAEVVEAMARDGMLGFFGAGGLSLSGLE